MKIEFWVELKGSEYGASGWPCSALGLPSARIAKVLTSNGRATRDPSELDYRAGQLHFRSPPARPIPDLTLLIEVKKRLLTVDSAVVVALITLVGTFSAAYLAYLGAVRANPAVAAGKPPETASASAATGAPPPAAAPATAPSHAIAKTTATTLPLPLPPSRPARAAAPAGKALLETPDKIERGKEEAYR